jgi:hypothetical protein
MLTDILQILNLVDTKAQDIWTAVGLGISDFEDTIVAAVAHSENADYIVTRNCADFVNSPVPAISPADFLKFMKN